MVASTSLLMGCAQKPDQIEEDELDATVEVRSEIRLEKLFNISPITPQYQVDDLSPSQSSGIPVSSPSAICIDGTYSYSRSRRGTCSGHGGVARWLPSITEVIPNSIHSIAATVTRVIDGDTIDVLLETGTKERIRLMGVDTPETFEPNKRDEYGNITDLDCLDAWGDKATDFTIRHLRIGTSVVLEFDTVQRKDVYERLLAYVHLPGDDDFNKQLVENGLARVYEEGDSTREMDYLHSQLLAVEAGVGLWECIGE